MDGTGLSLYAVLVYDFGTNKEHCFMPVRPTSSDRLNRKLLISAGDRYGDGSIRPRVDSLRCRKGIGKCCRAHRRLRDIHRSSSSSAGMTKERHHEGCSMLVGEGEEPENSGKWGDPEIAVKIGRELTQPVK